MSGEFLYMPSDPHRCALPWRERGAMHHDKEGARWQCGCGKRWIYLPITWDRGWVPLRWWHRWTRPMKEETDE